MNAIQAIWAWMSDPARWSGADGIGARLLEHLGYSVITVAVAAALAVPLGLWIGHTGHGRVLAVAGVNAMRAMPTLGLLFAAILVVTPLLPGGLGFTLPALAVLVVLAVPPILSGTYSGVESVDPAARDAAKGLGMSSAGVLRRVELPCALPLIWSGIRAAMLQVVATATVAASVGVGGLGRLLFDGMAAKDYGQMGAGAVLVALLALACEAVLWLVQRWAVSPGLRRG